MAKDTKRANGNGDSAVPESQTGKLPPQNLDAERSMLGGMMLSPMAIDEAQAVIEPEHLYADQNRRVCEAIFWLRDHNRDVDAITVGRELEKRKELADIGGTAYLIQLMESVPHAAHTKHYAEIVRECWVKRTIIDSCTTMLRKAYDPSVSGEDALTQHDNETQRLLETGVHAAEIGTLASALMDALTEDKEERERSIVPTGYAELDDRTGGLRGGNLIVVAARASMGKTALANNLILSMIRAQRPVLFFSLEQGAKEIGERMLSIDSEVSAHKLRKSELTPEDHAVIAESQNRMAALPLFIDDRGERTVAQIGATIRLFRRRHKIEAVVIDYLQLIKPEDSNAVREQQVARSSRALKHLARNLNVPIVVLAQLNRDIEKRDNKRPRLSDMRESGAVEQDADQVWAIHRPEYYDAADSPGVAEIHVLKNRNGPIGVVRMYWIAENMRFVEQSIEEAAALSQKSLEW